MSNLLQDHIDDPIKKAVVGMNFLGFKTYMSCCGFTYENEKVQKSHLGKAYIYLDNYQVSNNRDLLVLLGIISLETEWRFERKGVFIDFYGDTWNEGHPWSMAGSVHSYEKFLLAIHSLVTSLISKKEYFQKSAVIEDGNEYYIKHVSKYWKCKPTESWVVTSEDFDSL
jgi:hypothetical protein